jgi:hypothetical protein
MACGGIILRDDADLPRGTKNAAPTEKYPRRPAAGFRPGGDISGGWRLASAVQAISGQKTRCFLSPQGFVGPNVLTTHAGPRVESG